MAYKEDRTHFLLALSSIKHINILETTKTIAPAISLSVSSSLPLLKPVTSRNILIILPTFTMKVAFTTIALAVISQLASAGPVKRDFSQADIQNFVNNWNTDVQNVNNFLDEVFVGGLTVGNSDDLSNAAQAAQTFAEDEPMELMRLGSLPQLSQQGINAAMNLMQVFGPRVLDNLQKIINSPGNNQTVTDAVDGINNVRCFNVLPDLCNLWPASFSAVGLDPGTAPLPQFEKACKGIFEAAGDTPACQGKEPVFA
jgi:hypothetical protein